VELSVVQNSPVSNELNDCDSNPSRGVGTTTPKMTLSLSINLTTHFNLTLRLRMHIKYMSAWYGAKHSDGINLN
jgi:hypothetical protein